MKSQAQVHAMLTYLKKMNDPSFLKNDMPSRIEWNRWNCWIKMLDFVLRNYEEHGLNNLLLHLRMNQMKLPNRFNDITGYEAALKHHEYKWYADAIQWVLTEPTKEEREKFDGKDFKEADKIYAK